MVVYLAVVHYVFTEKAPGTRVLWEPIANFCGPLPWVAVIGIKLCLVIMNMRKSICIICLHYNYCCIIPNTCGMGCSISTHCRSWDCTYRKKRLATYFHGWLLTSSWANWHTKSGVLTTFSWNLYIRFLTLNGCVYVIGLLCIRLIISPPHFWIPASTWTTDSVKHLHHELWWLMTMVCC